MCCRAGCEGVIGPSIAFKRAWRSRRRRLPSVPIADQPISIPPATATRPSALPNPKIRNPKASPIPPCRCSRRPGVPAPLHGSGVADQKRWPFASRERLAVCSPMDSHLNRTSMHRQSHGFALSIPGKGGIELLQRVGPGRFADNSVEITPPTKTAIRKAKQREMPTTLQATPNSPQCNPGGWCLINHAGVP